MGKQGVFLEHHADMPLLRRNHGIRRGDPLTGQRNSTPGHPLKSGDGAKNSRFAAAGRPEEAENLPLVDREGDALDGRSCGLIGARYVAQFKDGRSFDGRVQSIRDYSLGCGLLLACYRFVHEAHVTPFCASPRQSLETSSISAGRLKMTMSNAAGAASW